jgi:hypothetical protein
MRKHSNPTTLVLKLIAFELVAERPRQNRLDSICYAVEGARLLRYSDHIS